MPFVCVTLYVCNVKAKKVSSEDVLHTCTIITFLANHEMTAVLHILLYGVNVPRSPNYEGVVLNLTLTAVPCQ
jgi:hypothetical protein